METLKLKIFDVLVNNITIEEFENWLYSSELLKEDLKVNSLLFEVVNINYRKDRSIDELKEIASNIFKNEDFIVMKIEENCRKIINDENSKNIQNYVFNIVQYYDFDVESNVYSDFYNLYYSFDGYDYTNYTKGSLEKMNSNTVNYAKSVIESLETARSVTEKAEMLRNKTIEKRIEVTASKPTKEYKKENKTPLIRKIFAFLKKI